MSDTSAINSSGSQSGGSAQTDAIDAGQSDDIENSLTGQGVSDRETVEDIQAAHQEKPSPANDES
jgi:hypothetical protein